MSHHRIDSLQEKIKREFSRSLLEDWDRQFVRTLLLTLFLEAVLIVVMVLRPVEEYSQAEIERIQERFANFIISQEEQQVPVTTQISTGAQTAADEGRSAEEEAEQERPGTADRTGEEGRAERETQAQGGTEGQRGQGEAPRRPDRQAAAESRRQSREAMSRSVSSKGLLGLLTGTGNAAQGQAVDNFLSGSGNGSGGGDLDQILSSVDGLQTQGQSGLGGPGGTGSGIGDVRGSRSGQRTSIDDLVSERSDMATASMSRQGDLHVENPTDVVGRGNKSAYRSPDAIREVLLNHVPAIRYCYDRELKRDPELKGKISVRITVSADGNVTDAVILTSTLNNERVERCVLARIRLWKDFRPIDPGEGDVTFRQVYTFGI
ncbi:TonB family protein [bacterium]|nr:TonB family protein [bacterium]